jgi:hypothetical protein
MATTLRIVEHLKQMSVLVAIAVLAGCGGGGSDRPCVDDPARAPGLPTCSGTAPPPSSTASSVTLVLVDATGNPITAVSPTGPGFVQATVKDTNGNVAPNIVVTFTTSDGTGGFNPTSGTALTDSSGVAKVTLLAGSSVGAFILTAKVSGTTTGTGGSTVGIVNAYSANLGYAVTQPNLPASATGSIKFVGAEPPNIALKGTGGVGRQEFSSVTFQVFDHTGHAVQGAQVNFTLNTTVGGLSLMPQSAVTDAAGKVVTVVSAGTIPTPVVIVTASVPSSGITTVSNVLVLSTGLATDSRTSLAVVTGNCEGWDFDGDCTGLTVRMGDHFGNPVPDGTAANFSAAYGIVSAACLTGDLSLEGTPPTSIVSGEPGLCTVKYMSAGARPPGGRSVVLAYARGEEDFFDANGNNVCDGCANAAGPEFKAVNDLKPDAFRDDSENGAWTPGEPCISPSGNATCSTPPDGVYNGVLANPKIPDAQQTIYLRRQYVAIWSGSHAYISTSSTCVGSPASAAGTVHVRIVDVNGNPMPARTAVAFAGSSIGSDAKTSFTVANYLLGVGQKFGTGPGQVPIEEYDIPVSCSAGTPVQITVTTPRGIATSYSAPIR